MAFLFGHAFLSAHGIELHALLAFEVFRPTVSGGSNGGNSGGRTASAQERATQRQQIERTDQRLATLFLHEEVMAVILASDEKRRGRARAILAYKQGCIFQAALLYCLSLRTNLRTVLEKNGDVLGTFQIRQSPETLAKAYEGALEKFSTLPLQGRDRDPEPPTVYNASPA